MQYRRDVPLDPIVSLAVALAEAPGACACLLGAGVSVDAGVPTASGIRQDGLRHLYRLDSGDDANPDDEQLAEWLREQGHEDLGYSSLLDLIAPDPAIRRDLLAGYFSGAEPGLAHERLADLAAAGVLSVFVTTNFDRLLERALASRGIEPVVVSDDATLHAAPRREHSGVFVVKAHGDYLQETIRNTPSELAGLDPELTRELRAIVDHYGLLVVGWSGQDPALAEVFRGRSSRYGAWWLARTDEPPEPARTLIEATGARLIVRPGAGEFLGELVRRLAIYRTHESGDDPGSVHDQVLGLLKRREDVDLDELLRRERHAFESAVETVRRDCAGSGENTEEHVQCWERLAAATDRRIGSLIPLAVHRPELFATAIYEHTAWATGLPAMSGRTGWVYAWQFPFWIIGMTIGGLAIRLDRYEALHPLLAATWSDPNGYKQAFVLPNEMGEFVGGRFGPQPAPNPGFAAWGWLPHDIQAKEWLVSRYPEWLRRDGEPAQSFTEFSLLLYLARRLLDEGWMAPWWNMNIPAAEGYAKRLHGDSALRARAAEAVAVTLEKFDELAPDILESAQGFGLFPDTHRVARTLRTGSW